MWNCFIGVRLSENMACSKYITVGNWIKHWYQIWHIDTLSIQHIHTDTLYAVSFIWFKSDWHAQPHPVPTVSPLLCSWKQEITLAKWLWRRATVNQKNCSNRLQDCLSIFLTGQMLWLPHIVQFPMQAFYISGSIDKTLLLVWRWLLEQRYQKIFCCPPNV